MKRDTRQDILNTAQTLFREKGYNAVSVGEIAAALGISRSYVSRIEKKALAKLREYLQEVSPNR